MRRALPLAVVLIAGIVVAAMSDGTAGRAVGFVLSGLAGILLVALAFYEVGMSEERDRQGGRS